MRLGVHRFNRKHWVTGLPESTFGAPGSAHLDGNHIGVPFNAVGPYDSRAEADEVKSGLIAFYETWQHLPLTKDEKQHVEFMRDAAVRRNDLAARHASREAARIASLPKSRRKRQAAV